MSDKPAPSEPSGQADRRPLPLGLVSAEDVAAEPTSDAITPTQDSEGIFRPPGILAGVGRMMLETGPVALPLRGLGKAFDALSQRDYRLLWFGAMFSNMGMWVQVVALQWLIKSLSPDSSAWWLGKAAFLQQVPTVLLLPLGGALADRLNKRWIILAGNLCLAMVSLSMAVMHAMEAVHIWTLMGVAVILGIWQAALIPASQALLPMLVTPDKLPNAVALNSMQFNISRAIGPAIGGVALLALGATWSFGINALAYAGIITAVFLIRSPMVGKGRHESVLRSMRNGAIYLRGRKDLLLVLTSVLLYGVMSSPMLFMLPTIVEQLCDDSPAQFTQLLSAYGVGAVIGAGLLAARSQMKASPWRALVTMATFGVCEALIAVGWPFYVTLGLTFLCGLSMVGSLNRFFAAVIGTVPSHVQGRVSSFYMLSLTLGFPMGSILAGKLASMYGIAPVLATYGLSMVGIMAAIMLLIWTTGLKFRDDSDRARHG